MNAQLDTGYVQTGAAVVETNDLAPGCGGPETTFDTNLGTGICINGGFIVLDFNPAGTNSIDELWIKTFGAAGSLAHGFGPLIFSLYNWNANQFQDVKVYNEAVPEIWHWIEFKIVDHLQDLIRPDGTIRLKIESVSHTGTSGRVREVYVRAVRGECTRIECLPVRVIDGIGPQIAQDLVTAGIDNVEELYMIDPIPQSAVTNLSVARLYEFQRKADLAINTDFDRNVYDAVFNQTLISIIELPDADLQAQGGLNQAQAADLKTGIATLFVALDNSAIQHLTLVSFEA